ncbi:hypothetical protein [Nocardioides sp. InS609-2]|uniref:hypothetical protein n=1 Tax=Nocardioides sp. InS609-2 TaxID=2760705 RepID=UPI0020BF203C|nr:hypothetical protein [Nocardioides sp. InS609-2]
MTTPAAKPRPHAAWWIAPPLVIAVGIGLGILCAVRLFAGTFQTDATVPADGQPHPVRVDDTGRQLVWVRDGRTPPMCTVEDSVTGRLLTLDPPTDTYTKTTGGMRWQAAYAVDAPHRALVLSCAALPGEQAQIGSALSGTGMATTIVGVILFPLLLGGAGLLWLILLAVTWSRRPPRTVERAAG